MAAYCCPLHWAWKTVDLDPFPLCPAFPDSLDGCDSVEYYGSAVPPRALVTCPPIPSGSSCRFRRCSHSHFSVSLRYPSVTLLPDESGREACLSDAWSLRLPG